MSEKMKKIIIIIIAVKWTVEVVVVVDEFLLVKHHGLAVSDNENADRTFIALSLSLSTQKLNQTSIFFVFWVFLVPHWRSFTYCAISQKKQKTHLRKPFNWIVQLMCTNSTAANQYTFTCSVFSSWHYMRNQEQHIMHIDLAYSPSSAYTHTKKKTEKF